MNPTLLSTARTVLVLIQSNNFTQGAVVLAERPEVAQLADALAREEGEASAGGAEDEAAKAWEHWSHYDEGPYTNRAAFFAGYLAALSQPQAGEGER